MVKRKKFKSEPDRFIRETSFVLEDGKVLEQGDLIKIKGIWGTKFKFHNYVTNPEINKSWIDCVELEKGVSCGMRSFYADRVKRIPKKRGKNVKRNRQNSKTS